MKYTKTTKYIAPLIKLYPNIIQGFLNCYISKDNSTLYVISTSRDNINSKHPEYIGAYKISNLYSHSYNIPYELRADVKLILEGKYSEISEAAKDNIKNTPGLSRKMNIDGKEYIIYEDSYFVVTKDPMLGEPLAERLGVPLEMLSEYDSKPIKEQEYYETAEMDHSLGIDDIFA